jgi:plastocyanin domain-containing protein
MLHQIFKGGSMKNVLLASLIALAFNCAHAASADTQEEFKVEVTENGFEPSQIKTKAGSHVVMKFTRTTDATCAKAIQFKDKKIKKDLPLNKEVSVDLGTLKKGDITFACGMDMISGHIVAE